MTARTSPLFERNRLGMPASRFMALRGELAHRGGETFEPALDGARIADQHRRVLDFMRDGQWHTLAEIEAATGDPQASASARLRDFRKPRFGAMIVERRRRTAGTFEYRIKGNA